ncbi:MAG: TorF family putative porin, partial [Bradyrhizobium sp.]|uniref:TorF family putative porin n=1 Tax=Bradyrhizobium sp. TaxID=376 RepID=UPI0023A46DF6
MKKLVLLATALAMASGSALAADMPLKAEKAPAAFDPWDIAFGAAVMNDYVFRGVTQSNHRPSVTAYFEPRYNVNKDLQLYIGTSAESISFANRAAAEVDVYGGIRPTFGAAAFDLATRLRRLAGQAPVSQSYVAYVPNGTDASAWDRL